MSSKSIYKFIALAIFLSVISLNCELEDSVIIESDTISAPIMKLLPPDDNKIYHAAFPDFGGTEDVVSQSRITAFESLVGKEITWAYFSNNWTKEKDSIVFPKLEVQIIHQSGKVPFIRMMPRSNFNEGGPDTVYTMQNIISGNFDNQLKQWAIDAKNTQIPLLVEFEDILNDEWNKILNISPQGKPIAILEWGIVDDGQSKKSAWIINAMNSIKQGGKFYPYIKAVSYWHENFGNIRLRIDSSPESLSAYGTAMKDSIFISKPKF